MRSSGAARSCASPTLPRPRSVASVSSCSCDNHGAAQSDVSHSAPGPPPPLHDRLSDRRRGMLGRASAWGISTPQPVSLSLSSCGEGGRCRSRGGAQASAAARQPSGGRAGRQVDRPPPSGQPRAVSTSCLIKRRAPTPPGLAALPAACSCAHLDAVLQWAWQQDCPWNEKTCSRAASGGHLAVLQWARQHGCPWNENTCSRAASGGHLAVLQWARQHGCPWDNETCRAAAEGGHLAVLQWARRQGCPWDRERCMFAVTRHAHVCAWIGA